MPSTGGDLKCYTVKKRGDAYIAYIEEASPDSENLKNYIEGWLRKWGWNVVVEVHW